MTTKGKSRKKDPKSTSERNGRVLLTWWALPVELERLNNLKSKMALNQSDVVRVAVIELAKRYKVA